MKNYTGTNEVFRPEAEKRIIYFDCSVLDGTLYRENWQYSKMGWNNFDFKISTVYVPYKTSNSLFIITERK